MTATGMYYIGRVVKLGEVNWRDVVEAIKSPVATKGRKNAWTFSDVIHVENSNAEYVFAHVCKFSPDASLEVFDSETRGSVLRDEPNLVLAKSPFIYIPKYSGVAFLHVSPDIPCRVFMDRFSALVTGSLKKILAKVIIEPVADLRTFAVKLQSLDVITELAARVHPPNPLFGPLWKSLKEYLETRNASQVDFAERSAPGEALVSKLAVHVSLASQQSDAVRYEPEVAPDIGDAALLMAADGYGDGKVVGLRRQKRVVIKTSETAKNFEFDRSPGHEELYLQAVEIFEDIERKRHLEH